MDNTTLIAIVLISVFALFTWYKFAKHKFVYRKGYPSTRYCYCCGQKQIEVHEGKLLNGKPLTHWEDAGKVYDKNCHCHDYANI